MSPIHFLKSQIGLMPKLYETATLRNLLFLERNDFYPEWYDCVSFDSKELCGVSQDCTLQLENRINSSQLIFLNWKMKNPRKQKSANCKDEV